MPAGIGLGIALVAGLWVTVASSLAADADLVIAPIVAVLLALVRVAVYCTGRSSPLGLAGRLLRLRRIVLPGFDVIFVAPLAAVLISLAPAPWMGTPLAPVLDGCATAAALAILLLAPPSLEVWRLTGAHDSRPPPRRQVGGPHSQTEAITAPGGAGHR